MVAALTQTIPNSGCIDVPEMFRADFLLSPNHLLYHQQQTIDFPEHAPCGAMCEWYWKISPFGALYPSDSLVTHSLEFSSRKCNDFVWFRYLLPKVSRRTGYSFLGAIDYEQHSLLQQAPISPPPFKALMTDFQDLSFQICSTSIHDVHGIHDVAFPAVRALQMPWEVQGWWPWNVE